MHIITKHYYVYSKLFTQILFNMDSNNDIKNIKLNAKLSKFMLFGFWLLDSLKHDNLIDDTLFASIANKLKLFHNPSEQLPF